VKKFATQTGGRAAASLAEVGLGADAVITMLPDGKAVQKAVLGDGVAAVLEPGALVVLLAPCRNPRVRLCREHHDPAGRNQDAVARRKCYEVETASG
jgi:3-hydroxyisobutyrate dehydrogenase-like beta-hydroxyacid dehydrogenase